MTDLDLGAQNARANQQQAVLVKHTPGPWQADNWDGWHVEEFATGQMVCIVVGERPRDQRGADAKLIASAPSLADALEDAVRSHEPCVPDACWCVAAKAALRLAGRLP